MQGELLFETHEGRTIEYTPRECVDGHTYGYFGVELSDHHDRVLEFFRDGEDPGLIFYAPGQAAFELGPADCVQFSGELHRDSFAGSDSGTVRGNLELDCVAPNGWRIVGEVSFEECREPCDEDCEDDYDW